MRYLCFCLLLLSGVSHSQKLKPFSYYLGNSKITPTAKTVYKNLAFYKKDMSKFWPYYDKNEDKIMAMIDSVNTTNNDTRPFYLYILSRLNPLGDGGFGESMSLMVNRFIINHPAYFFSYMIDNPAEQKMLPGWSDNFDIGLKMQEPELCREEKQRLLTENEKLDVSNIVEDPAFCKHLIVGATMDKISSERKEIKKLAYSFLGNMVPANLQNKEYVVFAGGLSEQSLTVKKGAQFIIQFPPTASGTGYSWETTNTPSHVVLLKREFLNVPHEEGMVGTPQYALLTFQATKAGEEDIDFVYRPKGDLKETGKVHHLLHLKVK